jgi:hypothetical protein
VKGRTDCDSVDQMNLLEGVEGVGQRRKEMKG